MLVTSKQQQSLCLAVDLSEKKGIENLLQAVLILFEAP